MKTKSEYTRLVRLQRQLSFYLADHPEALSLTLSQLLCHLQAQEMPALLQQIEAEKVGAQQPAGRSGTRRKGSVKGGEAVRTRAGFAPAPVSAAVSPVATTSAPVSAVNEAVFVAGNADSAAGIPVEKFPASASAAKEAVSGTGRPASATVSPVATTPAPVSEAGEAVSGTIRPASAAVSPVATTPAPVSAAGEAVSEAGRPVDFVPSSALAAGKADSGVGMPVENSPAPVSAASEAGLETGGDAWTAVSPVATTPAPVSEAGEAGVVSEEGGLETVAGEEKEKNKKKKVFPPYPLFKEKEINKEKEAKKKKEESAKAFFLDYPEWDEDTFRRKVDAFAAQYPRKMLDSFFCYWADRSPCGQMRFQLQPSFYLPRRLAFWQLNSPLALRSPPRTARRDPLRASSAIDTSQVNYNEEF